jgi:Na+:H+ antiporter, NhaA family
MQQNRTPTVDKVLLSMQEFLRLEAAGGLLLMGAAAIALLIANSPLATYYFMFLEMPVEIRVNNFDIAKPLLLWVNDGLMAVFFFLVGMELKREVMEGHLSSLARASLPAFAATGGMLVPAAFYVAFNYGDAAALQGWAIPAATDIAFALGVLTLLGNRVPPSLKAFLLSVAIFDDLGAIVVIALFYTAQLSVVSLAVAAILVAGLALLNRSGVIRPAAYFVLGIPLWIAVLKSGVHATLAGVVLAMFIPLRMPRPIDGSPPQESLLHHLEDTLHPWVAFGVLPMFAFVNAGVPLIGLSITDLLHPVPLGIVCGLFFGKQLGVLGMCWIAIRAGIAALPYGTNWRQLHGITLLCGIGFTMSLFIASLAFEVATTPYSGLERLGILIGSLLSGGAGYLLLRSALGKEAKVALQT